MYRACIIISLFLLFHLCLLKGQSPHLSNNRTAILTEIDSVSIIDSFSIISYTLDIQKVGSTEKLDSSFYVLDNNSIIWKKRPPLPLQINYRVFPFNLEESFSRLDTSIIGHLDDEQAINIIYNPFQKEVGLIDFKGLAYNGSFSRGISFGNNQDLVLNSRFNLQLAGSLGDDIEILAAITDENIPLQPQGNTQQLQEFDKIFIQIKRRNNSITAGDYELSKPIGYFMNYFKKLQGASFQNQTSFESKGILSSSASIAIARGKFARNNIEQQEGNQGPYKLRGAEGERFIILLAGTEKVWMDGELLERGIERDYIVDYNRGEISFTNRRLVTKDSRLVVEFEYADQNYLRTMYAVNSQYSSKKWNVYFNLFNQQDSRTSTGNITLSQADRDILRDAGDNLAKAVVRSIDSLNEDNSFRVGYTILDTLINCGGLDTTIQILRFSNDPQLVQATARFSLVGAGMGNYILNEQQIANERIYQYIAPDPVTCQPRGNFEPISQLAAPQQQQMFTLGSEYQFSENAYGKTEIALSNLDLNRFSNLDAQDNIGIAVFSQYHQDFKLGKDSSLWKVSGDVSYEFVQKTFISLNPYRNPDFLRDWNLANVQGISQIDRADEHIALFGLQLRHTTLGSLSYDFSTFLRDTIYNGYKHTGVFQFDKDSWNILAKASLVNTDEPIQRTQLFRPNITIEKTLPFLDNWRLGFYGEREKSDRYRVHSDSLSDNSFFFDQFSCYLSTASDRRTNFELKYKQRNDYAPNGLDYTASNTAREASAEGQWNANKRIKIGGNFTFRQLEVIDSTISKQEAADTYLSRIDIGLNLIKGALQSNTTYEIGGGQEAKVAFTYIEVMPGTGTHIWLDSIYNNDGIIQPNEMEIAPFPDQANFVRLTTITDEFIRTNNVGLTQSLRITPRAIWFNEEGFKKTISKLSTISNIKITRKTRESSGVSSWNPLQLNIADTALVAISSSLRNVLFYNRGDAIYDLQLGQNDNRNRFVQTSGFESRRLSEHYFQARLNFRKTISSQIRLANGIRASDSEFFNNKDYRIRFFNIAPQFTLFVDQRFRTILKYEYQYDQNELGDNQEKSKRNEVSLEAAFNQSVKTALRLNASFIKIEYTGEINSPVGFAILNGLQNGQNFLWNVSLDRQLGQNIQLNISYEGRKTGTAKIVHVGRAQISANF